MLDSKTILTLLLAAALVLLFLRHSMRRSKMQTDLSGKLFAEICPLLTNANIEASEAVGTWRATGIYRGRSFQLNAIIDTLALRKLPSLWLMVTLPEPQPVTATFDLMMRPNGPTTFSNFDFLPHTLRNPPGVPEGAIIRSDSPSGVLPSRALSLLSGLFSDGRGKELLLSPKGLRIVAQAAEADRARYGVFREANFGEISISAGLAREIMDALLTLDDQLRKEH